MSGNPLAVTNNPGGSLGCEWNLEEDKVRKMAYHQDVGGEIGKHFFLDDEDVFCVNRETIDVLYIWNEDVHVRTDAVNTFSSIFQVEGDMSGYQALCSSHLR